MVVLLVADGLVLACPMENRPLEEPDVLAGLLAREVVQAVADTGVRPPRVSIRQPSLEGPLRALLAPHGIAVTCVEHLPGLDVALHDLMTHVFGANVPLSQLRSQPETWAGWGLPGALVAQLFEAAAAFRRAAPWEVVPPDLPILVSRPGTPLPLSARRASGCCRCCTTSARSSPSGCGRRSGAPGGRWPGPMPTPPCWCWAPLPPLPTGVGHMRG